MSFSSSLKQEMSKTKSLKPCCKDALCYGMLLFGKNFSFPKINIMTESHDTARLISQLTSQLTGTIVETKMLMKRSDITAYDVSIPDIEDCKRIFYYFGHNIDEIHTRINKNMIEQPCCLKSFLKGAFLSCGTAVDPNKDYRLEFIVQRAHLADDFLYLLKKTGEVSNFNPIKATRQGINVIYFKGADNVENFISYLGASHSAMTLIETKILKELKNNVNRKTNFETANIDKTASASAEQILAIENLLKKGGWNIIPDELREICEIRYNHPELSLRELGKQLTPSLSRSGVNHRLQKIISLSHKV